MCKLSHGKCVCFIFLVIVAFLSCSGFRIDKLTMTDLSRKNFHRTSLHTSLGFLDRLLGADFRERSDRHKRTLDDGTVLEVSRKRYDRQRHRIRHAKHRHLTTPNQNPRQEEIIDFPAINSPIEATVSTTEQFIQIPSSDVTAPRPTHAIVNRSQRSPKRKRKPAKKNRSKCQKPDVARKAAMANTVIRAKIISMRRTPKINSNYSVTFHITKVYKIWEPPLHETIRLTFANDTHPPDCEPEIKTGLVKANLKQSREYFLFLNSTGSYNYSVLGLPVLVRKNRRNATESRIAKACVKGFAQKIKAPQLERTHGLKENRITCTARGFPVPMIYWKKNGEWLKPSKKHKFRYSGRKSTLVLSNFEETDHGKYKCVTQGFDGSETQSIDTHLGDSVPCNATLSPMCIHGDCFILKAVQEPFCVCRNSFQGMRCEHKTSTYQQNITSCNLPQYRLSHFCQ